MDDSTDAEGTEVTMGELCEILEASRLRTAPNESSEAKRFGGELEDRGWGIERFQSLSGPPEAQAVAVLLKLEAEVVETLLPARDDDGGDHIMR